ncbi:unnamed protein product [Macrosiphum euphorbiae]|uniref:Uncharacterized protein n=1 Tax=Macrosiphum euphorbiae TaxID=13131 RepID=A0AAV0W519_9HEMI|nr:unnamed protein product [Macrosiphum euphorbiae]
MAYLRRVSYSVRGYINMQIGPLVNEILLEDFIPGQLYQWLDFSLCHLYCRHFTFVVLVDLGGAVVVNGSSSSRKSWNGPASKCARTTKW